MPNDNRVTLLDSTLRDGAQGEGISFSVADKIGVTLALDELGIDLIEAGNPGSNPKDTEYFREAKRLNLKHSKIVAFGPTRRKGVTAREDSGLVTLLGAGTETIVIFGKTWDFHVEQVLRATLDENVEMIADTIKYLRADGRKVIYDAEHFFDGYAANPDYAMRTLRAAADAGAECLVLCDTNGGSLPSRVTEFTAKSMSVGIPVGIHAHNDSGLAVANTIVSVEAGATHVQGTLAGFGERCGNANLSTIIADLALKMDKRCLPEATLPGLAGIVRRVAEISNVTIDEGMPFIGLKAFAHKAGMHVDAVTKTPKSFEHVPPETVGNDRRFLASEVGGRSVIMEKFRKIDPGASKDSPGVVAVTNRLKEMEAKGYQYEGADASLELLMWKAIGKYEPFFVLSHYRTIGEQPTVPGQAAAHAMVKISVGGESEISAAEGNGPVNALDQALRRALTRFYPDLVEMRLTDYKVRVIAASGATEASVRVLIESADSRGAWTTVGVSTDIIEASWIALVDSIEYKLIRDRGE